MRDDQPAITSERAFTKSLNALLQRADAGGLAVEGGWTCRNDVEHPDWDVVVTQVEKPDQTD